MMNPVFAGFNTSRDFSILISPAGHRPALLDSGEAGGFCIVVFVFDQFLLARVRCLLDVLEILVAHPR